MSLRPVLWELNELPIFIFYFYWLKLYIESRSMRQNVLAIEMKNWVSINYSSCNYSYTIEISKYGPISINRQKKWDLKCQIFQSFLICRVILNYAHTEDEHTARFMSWMRSLNTQILRFFPVIIMLYLLWKVVEGIKFYKLMTILTSVVTFLFSESFTISTWRK